MKFQDIFDLRFRKPLRLVLGCRWGSSTVDLVEFRCVSGSQRYWAVGGDCAQMFSSFSRGLFRRASLRPSKLRATNPLQIGLPH